MEECPHCGSKQTFKFKVDIYIVEGNDFIKKPFYGCESCKSAFVVIDKEDRKKKDTIITTTSATNVQKTLNRLSKGCLGVLENVK